MRIRAIFLLFFVLLASLPITTSTSGHAQGSKKRWLPAIPKTWDDEAMPRLEIPLARPDVSPKYVSSDYYYRMPVRPIYKSYPVYHPGKEPADYMNRLKQRPPQITFDPSKLRTKQDWTKAGETIFDAPIDFVSSGQLFSGVRDPAWYEKNQVPITRAGIFPFMRYVVRERGKIELGILSCTRGSFRRQWRLSLER